MKPNCVLWGKIRFRLGADGKYREELPKHPDANSFVAPEHYHVAVLMKRVQGVLQIDPNPIFDYSQKNPPAWLKGAVRHKLTTR